MGPDLSITPESVQARGFASAFRGYDAGEVKAFLAKVATELKAWRERAEQLESAWHSAEERAARPPVLDEDTLMAAVGEETATILRTARAAAADLRSKAAEETDKALSEARAEADRLLSEAQAKAERAVQQAQTDAARILQEAGDALAAATAEAEQAAAAIRESARQDSAGQAQRAAEEAEKIRGQAELDRKLTIEGANATRDKILEDLSRRRRVATVQIEQLRAGRERLIESYAMVRRTLEEVQSELSRADAEARAAADDVGRRLRDEQDVELSEDPNDELGAAAATGEGAAPSEADAGAEAVVVAAEAPVETAVVEAAVGEAAGLEAAVIDPAGSEATRSEVAAVEDAADAPPAATSAEPTTAGGISHPPSDLPTEEIPGSAVDELFARIRGKGDDAPPSEKRSGRKKGASSTQATATVVEEAEDFSSEPAALSATSDGDESLLQRREFAIVDLETALTRRLKRVLQDEQNDVLDRLRSLKTAPTLENLLPDAREQTGRYAAAARPMLTAAAAAGAVFADETLAQPGRDAPVEVDVADLATETGGGIVPALRRRLEQAIELGAGDDQAVVVESLGAAYREWKTQRIERLAGDMLSAAFSRGTWQATPEGARMRWVVEDPDGRCPDCDDDALAGELPKGEVFPTGQRHPPAHSGCRCLLVPSRATT